MESTKKTLFDSVHGGEDLTAHTLVDKDCKTCLKVLPIDCFSKDSSRRSGLRHACKECDVKRVKEWRHANIDRAKQNRKRWVKDNPDKARLYRQRNRVKNRGWSLINGARTRARAKNIPFDLDQFVGEIQEKIDAGACELSGVKLNVNSKRDWDSPSIHRVIPELGYVRSNVLVVCLAINCAIGSWGEGKAAFVMQAWLDSRKYSPKPDETVSEG